MSVLDEPKPPAAAAVVIVNYFKARRLLEGLKSLDRATVRDQIELVVVDNSCDAEEYQLLASSANRQSFQLIRAETNLGYTRGCNAGVAALNPSRYVLLCNPDIIWDDPDTLRTLLATADANQSVGALAPLQFNDDGGAVEIARKFPNFLEQAARRLGFDSVSRLSWNPVMFGDKRSDLFDIDWVQSSCVLVRRSLWDQFAGLDERYFLFMADVELGRAIWQAGYRVCITAAARVRADGVRASAGGMMALLTSRAQRSHLADSIKFYATNGIRPLKRHKQCRRKRDIAIRVENHGT